MTMVDIWLRSKLWAPVSSCKPIWRNCIKDCVTSTFSVAFCWLIWWQRNRGPLIWNINSKWSLLRRRPRFWKFWYSQFQKHLRVLEWPSFFFFPFILTFYNCFSLVLFPCDLLSYHACLVQLLYLPWGLVVSWVFGCFGSWRKGSFSPTCTLFFHINSNPCSGLSWSGLYELKLSHLSLP